MQDYGKIQFIDSARYMSASHYQILLLISLKEFLKVKYKYEQKCKACRIKYKDSNHSPGYTNVKHNLML